MRLYIVGPAPHQLTHGVDEEGHLWSMGIFFDSKQSQPCLVCGQEITAGYLRVTDKALVCFEHVERIEPEGVESGLDLFHSQPS